MVLDLRKWWAAAVSRESFTHGLKALPSHWRESAASFEKLLARTNELVRGRDAHVEASASGEEKSKIQELVRMVEREIARPEGFFRFSFDQISDKMASLSKTFQRLKARAEMTPHVEGVMVANLASIMSEIDTAKVFFGIHKQGFEMMYTIAKSYPALHAALPRQQSVWPFSLDVRVLDQTFEQCRTLLTVLNADAAIDALGRIVVHHESLLQPLFNGVPKSKSSLPNKWELVMWLSMFLFCYGWLLFILSIVTWEARWISAYVVNSAIFLVTLALLHRKQVQLEISPLRTTISDTHLAVLRFLPPFRLFSRVWGQIHAIPLPSCVRVPMLTLYALAFSCNTSEMLYPMPHYRNLGEFFTRPLKPGARPVCKTGLASPVDAVVVSCHEVIDGVLEQVKGVLYSLDQFLGDGLVPTLTPSTRLFQITLYLSPGMYHRIHSPCDWTIHGRRHFPGTLFPVHTLFQRYMKGLFALNERVVLHGEDSQNRFFTLSAVGAYNVGSVDLIFDPEVRCNQSARHTIRSGDGARLQRTYGSGHVSKRGDEIGHFNLGSTVVLVFTAHESFRFHCTRGDRVQMGQCIGSEESQPTVPN